MTAIGLKMDFRVAQWPELLKQSLAGTLMMWNFAWQGKNRIANCFSALPTARTSGPPTTRALSSPPTTICMSVNVSCPMGRSASPPCRCFTLLVAYMPYKFHLHRILLDLAQPWLLGYRRHPFTTRTVGLSGCRRRGTSPDARLTMLRRILRVTSLLAIALATVLAIWLDQSRRFAMDRSHAWHLRYRQDARATARHRIHHRRAGRPGGRRPTRSYRFIASVVDRVMALVRGIQRRSALACELSRAEDRRRRCKTGGVARPRLYVQPRYVAALASKDCHIDWNIATVNLEPAHASVDDYAEPASRRKRHGCALTQRRRTDDPGMPQHGRARGSRLSCARTVTRRGARCHDQHPAPRNHLCPLCARREYSADATGVRVRHSAWRNSRSGRVYLLCKPARQPDRSARQPGTCRRRGSVVRENRSPGDDRQRRSANQVVEVVERQ